MASVEVEHHNHATDMVVEEEHQTESVGKLIGQCKWFNDNYGYGFVTICDGDDKGKDVFVHHSGIKPLNSNYRTLKKGEYLTFDLEEGAKGLQAINVKGIKGGPLMCDCNAIVKPKVSSSHTLMPSQHRPRFVRNKFSNVPPHMYAKGQWLVVTKTGRTNTNVVKHSKTQTE